MKRKGMRKISRIVSFMLILTMLTSLNGIDVLASENGNSDINSEEIAAEENEIIESEEIENPVVEEISESEVTENPVVEEISETEATENPVKEESLKPEENETSEYIEEEVIADEQVNGTIKISEKMWGDGSEGKEDHNKVYFYASSRGIMEKVLYYYTPSYKYKSSILREDIYVKEGWNEIDFMTDRRKAVFGDKPGLYYYSLQEYSSVGLYNLPERYLSNFLCLETPSYIDFRALSSTSVEVSCNPVENADEYIFRLSGKNIEDITVVSKEPKCVINGSFSKNEIYSLQAAASDSQNTYFNSDWKWLHTNIFLEALENVHMGNHANGEDPDKVYFTVPQSAFRADDDEDAYSSFSYVILLMEKVENGEDNWVGTITGERLLSKRDSTYGVDITNSKHNPDTEYYATITIRDARDVTVSKETRSSAFKFADSERLVLNTYQSDKKTFMAVNYYGFEYLKYCYQVKEDDKWKDVDSKYLTPGEEAKLNFNYDLEGKEIRVMGYGNAEKGNYCGKCYSNELTMTSGNPFDVEGLMLTIAKSSDGLTYDITNLSDVKKKVEVAWENVTIEWRFENDSLGYIISKGSNALISADAVEKVEYMGGKLCARLMTTINGKVYIMQSNYIDINKKDRDFGHWGMGDIDETDSRNSWFIMDSSIEDRVEINPSNSLEDVSFNIVIRDVWDQKVYSLEHSPNEKIDYSYFVCAEDGSDVLEPDSEYTVSVYIEASEEYNSFFTIFKLHTIPHRCEGDYCIENSDYVEHWKACSNSVQNNDRTTSDCKAKLEAEPHTDSDNDGFCDVCSHKIHKADLLYIENLNDCFFDNGAALKPEFEVWLGGRLLERDKEYTVSYKNNKNAADKDSLNSKTKRNGPSVTVKGKGNYSGTVTEYFTILPKALTLGCVDDIIVKETGKNIKINPSVVVEGKKLKAGKDFEIIDSTDGKVTSYKEKGEYSLKVKGIGNYTGSVDFKFTITEGQLTSKLKVAAIPNQKYTGTEITPEIKVGKKPIDTTKFKLTYLNNKEIGVGTVIISALPDSGYVGEKTVTFKIVGTSIASVKTMEKIPERTYSGEKYDPELKLAVADAYLVKDTDYTVEYFNDVNAGEAYALVTGMGKYSGTAKIKYKIKPFAVTEDNEFIKIDCTDKIEFSKGGAKPAPTVKFKDNTLVESVDYKLIYSNNTKIGLSDATNKKGKSIAPTVKITFKGNYSGTKSKSFTIESKDLKSVSAYAADTVYKSKKDSWKQKKVVLTDTDGKKLVAGKDYKITGYYPNLAPDTTEVKPNTEVTVKIEGINNYTGSVTCRYIVRAYDISSVKVKVLTEFKYTGEANVLTYSDLKVTDKSGKELTGGVDYVIDASTYANNVNKGTATVKIKGIGDYAGEKTVKYGIGIIKFLWWKLF